MGSLSRERFVDLMRRIMAGEGTDEELEGLCKLFDDNVPYPRGHSLAYWPDEYNARHDDISQYDPTPEEVVDKALAYKPIILPPPEGAC